MGRAADDASHLMAEPSPRDSMAAIGWAAEKPDVVSLLLERDAGEVGELELDDRP